MVMWLLLSLVVGAYGASIPPQPVIPTSSVCLQGCFESGSIVNAAFDLLNFRSIAVDIENFCSLNAALLKCGRECPAEQIRELEARTEASSFICLEKIEEFRLVSSCLEKTEDVTANCASKCALATQVPLRLDSSPAASVNPTVFLDGAGSSCKKHVCMLKCSQENFNQACAGAGDLFKDLAREQIRSGIERLAEDSSNDNVTTTKLMAQNYLKNLPSECIFLKDVEEFNKIMEAETTADKSETGASSTVASVTKATEAESASTEKSTELAEVKDPMSSSEQTEQSSIEHHDISTASASFEETTPAIETESVEGFTKATNEETAGGSATSTLLPVKELEEATLEVLRTIPVPVEATTQSKHIETNFGEDKTEFGMDVNSVDETTTAPTEPVIVVDDASENVGENDIQAGVKEEVKSSSALLAFSSLLAIGAALLLV